MKPAEPSLIAILCGSAITLFPSVLLGTFILFFVQISSFLFPMQTEIAPAVMHIMQAGSCLAFGILGGLVAGIVGRSCPALNATGAGLLGLLASFVLFKFWQQTPSVPWQVVGILPGAIVGGIIVASRSRRRPLAPPPIPHSTDEG